MKHRTYTAFMVVDEVTGTAATLGSFGELPIFHTLAKAVHEIEYLAISGIPYASVYEVKIKPSKYPIKRSKGVRR